MSLAASPYDVTSNGTAAALCDVSIYVQEFDVIAKEANTNSVTIARGSGVLAAKGQVLRPGDTRHYGPRQGGYDLSLFYIIAVVNGEGVTVDYA